MVLTHIKLAPCQIGDLWVICPTCGYFLKLYKDLSLFELSGAAEASCLEYCPNCTGGKTNHRINWLYFPALGAFVHNNSFTVAPFPDILQVMLDNKSFCSCGFFYREFLFSFERHPIICGSCGLLIWLDGMHRPAYYRNENYNLIQGAQLKALCHEHNVIALDYDTAFLEKRRTRDGWYKNRKRGVAPIIQDNRPMLVGPRRGEMMDRFLIQRTVNEELVFIPFEPVTSNK